MFKSSPRSFCPRPPRFRGVQNRQGPVCSGRWVFQTLTLLHRPPSPRWWPEAEDWGVHSRVRRDRPSSARRSAPAGPRWASGGRAVRAGYRKRTWSSRFGSGPRAVYSPRAKQVLAGPREWSIIAYITGYCTGIIAGHVEDSIPFLLKPNLKLAEEEITPELLKEGPYYKSVANLRTKVYNDEWITNGVSNLIINSYNKKKIKWKFERSMRCIVIWW